MARKKKQRSYSGIGHQRAIVGGAFAGYVGGAFTGGMAAANVRGLKAVHRGVQVGKYAGAAAGGYAGHRAYVKRHSNPDGTKRITKQSARSKRAAARTPAQTKKRHQRQRRAAYAAVGGTAALARLGATSARKTKVAGQFHKLGGVGANKVPAHKVNFSRPGRATYRKHGTPIHVRSHRQRAIGAGHGRQRRDRVGRFA